MLLSALLMCIFSLTVTNAVYTCTYTITSEPFPANQTEGTDTSTNVEIPYHPPGTLTSGLFANISIIRQCTTLRFHNVGIFVIERGAWLGLEKLKQLELRENELTALTAGMFENLYLLEHLNVTSNKIVSIDMEAFSNLTSLTELYMSQNSILVLQKDMFVDLTNLKSLILDRNQIFLIQDGAFNGLHSLNILGLEKNNLNISIFTSIDVFANITDTLTSLFLQGNWIDAIDNDMFERFTVLENLSITTKDIEEPNGFRGLDLLHNLWVTGLNIEDVGSNPWGQIGDTLIELKLQLNSGESLSEDMFQRTSMLRYLSLESSNISTIHPTALNSLNSLKHISLQLNNISEEELKSLQSVRQTLERLELSNNRIATIPKNTFDGFTVLRYLSLSSNRISVVISGGFYGLQSLTELDLSHNLISDVEPGSFEGLSSLRELYLIDNLLMTLQWTAFGLNCAPHSGQLTLGITVNPIVCDGRIEWMKDGQQHGWLSFFIDPPACHNFPDINWENVPIPEFLGYDCSALCCTDIDECLSTPCATEAICVNAIGSYYCSWPPGNNDQGYVITRLEPTFGPKAGGTLVTLHGSDFEVDEPPKIKIGSNDCLMNLLNESTMVCLVQPLDDNQYISIPQSVLLRWVTEERDTGFTFIYKRNPEILEIPPSVTALSGGIRITVIGTNVDSVAEPVMVMIVTTSFGTSTFYQACSVISEIHFVCFTPSLTKTSSASGRDVNSDCGPEMKYHNLTNQLAAGTIGLPDSQDVSATVNFLMDGAELKNDPFTLEVVQDPVIVSNVGQTVAFSTSFTCKKDLIEIEGEHLIDLSADMYMVTVGEETCKDIHVTETKITCKPPPKKPYPDTIVKVQIGCHSYEIYTLKYEGFLDCEETLYILVTCGVAVVGIVVIIAVCCRIRRNRIKRKRNEWEQSIPMSVYGNMPKTQAHTSNTTVANEHVYVYPGANPTAPSIAAPSEASYLHSYAYPKSTGTSIFNYAATEPDDYASIPASSQYQPLYEGHDHVYQETVPTYVRPTHGGETGSEMSYVVPRPTNPRDPVYSAPPHVRKGPSQLPKGPESVAASYATISKFNSNGQNTGVQMREKQGKQKSTWRRFSGRFSPGAIADDKNYPQAANAPSKRLSHWFSSDGTGLKKFRAFRQPWARHN